MNSDRWLRLCNFIFWLFRSKTRYLLKSERSGLSQRIFTPKERLKWRIKKQTKIVRS